jgi:AcrR family transcriptional regulator
MRSTEVQPGQDTKERILDVAERLFAENGFEQTSLRGLTAEAGVNLAAVHYHFGSKERLFEAVLQRLLNPVNRERIALLESLETQDPPALEPLIDAFVGPPLRLAAGGIRTPTACLLLGRCWTSPDDEMRSLLLRLFGSVLDRFVAAFSRALPHLPHHEVLWRIFFMVGVMAHTMTVGRHLAFMSGGACDPARTDETVARIVQAVAASMRAPVLEVGKVES